MFDENKYVNVAFDTDGEILVAFFWFRFNPNYLDQGANVYFKILWFTFSVTTVQSIIILLRVHLLHSARIENAILYANVAPQKPNNLSRRDRQHQ